MPGAWGAWLFHDARSETLYKAGDKSFAGDYTRMAQDGSCRRVTTPRVSRDAGA
jgi:hypothetical protein